MMLTGEKLKELAKSKLGLDVEIIEENPIIHGGVRLESLGSIGTLYVFESKGKLFGIPVPSALDELAKA